MPREDRSRPSDVSSGSPDSSSANSPTTSPDSSVSRAREEPPSPKGASSAPSSPSRSVSFSQKLTKAVAGEDPPRTSTKDSKDQHGATTAPAAGKSPPATASAPLARGRGPAAQQTPTRTISFDSATQKVQETMKAQTGLLREYFRALEPFRYRKGGGGRVAIWGGSALYAGAPYFAGTASLKAGADLVYLKVGHPSVAQALKARSPDLMCDATGDGLHFSEDDREVVGRCHCLVIGPGLGRNEEVLKEVKRVLKRSASWWPGLPIVLDADALHAVSEVEMICYVVGGGTSTGQFISDTLFSDSFSSDGVHCLNLHLFKSRIPTA